MRRHFTCKPIVKIINLGLGLKCLRKNNKQIEKLQPENTEI